MSSQQSARHQRSTGGLVTSLVVLVVIVVGYAGIKSLLAPHQTQPLQTVDYATVVGPAKQAADFSLVAPRRLPHGWRATSVRYTSGVGSHWHLGVLTARGRYVGLEQGKQSVGAALQAYVDPDPTRRGPVDVAGRTWSSYSDNGGDLALVRHGGLVTTLVVGHAVPRAQLVSYAASLR